MDLAVQTEHQRNGMFGDGMGGIGRDTRDVDLLKGCFEIDIVIPRSA